MLRHPKILILGCGVIGGSVLDLLTRMDLGFEITIAARDRSRLSERANLAIAVAMSLGLAPRVSVESIDVFNHDALAAMLSRLQPDIIINTTSLQTFWQISLLPKDAYQRLLTAEVGPWLPNHLAPARRIMLAVHEAAPRARVVNASFPDAVNPALATAGLAPSTGAGNVANTIPTFRRAAAMHLNIPVQVVDVMFVAHHVVGNSVATHGSARGAPFHLSVTVEGKDVSHEVPADVLFSYFVGSLKRQRGVPGQVMAASSVAAIARAIATDSGAAMHAPGPRGLVGGYPVHIGADEVRLRLPPGLSETEAIAINIRGQSFEGIDRIDPDGTVHFRAENMAVLTQAFGYCCSAMRLHEVDSWAADLQARYHRFASTADTPLAPLLAVG